MRLRTEGTNSTQLAASLLKAWKKRDVKRLEDELSRMEQICHSAPQSAVEQERLELLDGVVREMRIVVRGMRRREEGGREQAGVCIRLLAHLGGRRGKTAYCRG